MECYKYKKGQCYDNFKLTDGISAKIVESDLFVLITFNKPTIEEIESIQYDSFNMGVMKLLGIPYTAFQFRNLDSMDCLLLKEGNINDELLTLKLIFADNTDGRIVALRQHVLPKDFSDYIKYILKDEKIMDEQKDKLELRFYLFQGI